MSKEHNTDSEPPSQLEGGPFNVETLTLEAPRRDEVWSGSWPRLVPHRYGPGALDKGLPRTRTHRACHEGAGSVESV